MRLLLLLHQRIIVLGFNGFQMSGEFRSLIWLGDKIHVRVGVLAVAGIARRQEHTNIWL